MEREKDIVVRLLEACNGHPHAKIKWPHRVLHDAVNAIIELRKKRDRDLDSQTTTVGPFGDTEKKED